MARIKLGALITEMSGSIGGFSVQKNHYGTSLKVKNNPIRSISQSQSMRRGEISSLIPLWQNLTEAQRLQWNNYTSYNRQTAKNNSDSLLSGYNLFLKYNVLRLYAGLEVVLTPTYGLSNFVNILPVSANAGLINFTIASGYASPIFVNSNNINSWVSSTSDIFTGLSFKIAYNGSIFVAVGQGINTIAYSYDLISWHGLGTSIFSGIGYYVIWDGSKFIAGGHGTNCIAYSSDGINWTGIGNSPFINGCNCICYNGTMYVAVGAGTNTIAYSYNGISWTGIGKTHFNDIGSSVIWDGSMFRAGGGSTFNLASSSDGITWSHTLNSAHTSVLSIAYNGFRYLCGGVGDFSISYSSDFSSWTAPSLSFFASYCNYIFWSGTHFIAVGDYGITNLIFSTGGISWSIPVTNDSTNELVSISAFPDPSFFPKLLSANINFASIIDIASMYCIIKSSMPISSPNSILHKKRRIIPDITVSVNGISWGSNFISVWGRNPAAGEWITIEITFFSLVSSIVYKPVTQLCQLT